jgi:hypothetical protein
MRFLLAIFILTCSACATHVCLNSREPFHQQLGKELRTERVTYIYDFPHSPQSLWDHPHEYKHGGENELRTESPKAECPVGSLVQLRQVRQASRFDNPTVIEALGQIQCGGSAYEFRYVWGIGSEIHEAPWESPKYDASNTRPVLGDT